MSTKSQQFLAIATLHIGLAVSAASCSSAPETTWSENQFSRVEVERVPPTPTPTPDHSARIAPLHHRARTARAHLEFATAACLFRALRDHEATPEQQRTAFHTALGEAADLATGVHEIQRHLDRGEFEKATYRLKILSIQNPEVPFSAVLNFHYVQTPGTSLPTPGR
jgi:hypothetical protein